MNQNKLKVSIGRTIILVILVFILIASIGAFIGFASITMIKWWIPLLLSSVVAVATGTVLWRLWQKVTEIDSFALNYITHIIFYSLFLTGFLYTLNYFGSLNSVPHKEEAMVIEKYKERHYQSRRVGRNRYVRGNAYFEYYIEVRFNNGKDKKIQLPFSTYKLIKSGKEINLSLSKGWLGANVLHTGSILADNPDLSKPKERKKCRFFGTSGKRDIPEWIKKK
ncbi:MAG: hypothetical protein K2H18_06140 [Muribaculaceae bacterium]|nr:hypothetical protein [Muribaculaceae bacterium]